LVVRVTDAQGQAFAGASVTWSVIQGTGDLSATRPSTGQDGTTSIDIVLGEDVGQRALVARLDDSQSVTFTATGIPLEPEQLEKVDGDPSDLIAGSSTNVSVRVTDRFSNATPGTTVRWTAVAGGGSVADAESISDEDGVASATWTTGGVAGTLNELEALIEGTSHSIRFFTTTQQAEAPIVDTSDPLFGGLNPPPTGSPGTDASAIAMTIGGTVNDRSVISTAVVNVRVDGTDAAGTGFNGTCGASDYLLSATGGEIDRNGVDITNGTNSINFNETFTVTEPAGAVNPVGYCFELVAVDSARSKMGAAQGNSATLFTLAFVTWNP
jgi:hypothetical protein